VACALVGWQVSTAHAVTISIHVMEKYTSADAADEPRAIVRDSIFHVFMRWVTIQHTHGERYAFLIFMRSECCILVANGIG
jgi:hypothetical protein